jgi:anthranilate synthase/aminodeoxychorismate synthase-like glutamine amidotransferase
MVVIIDNYDSFTYNLAQLIQSLGFATKVIRNDQVVITDLQKIDISHFIISPGPGNPSDSGCSKEIINKFAGSVPILGVCLGFQVIADLFGGKIVRASYPCHGKTATLSHSAKDIFAGIPQKIKVARYHSLILDKSSVPDCLEILATADDIIMAIKHKEIFGLFGVQFHPESFLSEYGKEIVLNFLKEGL